MAASTYTTIQGDMWDTIAYRLWGNEMLSHHLLASNPSYRNMVIFPSGITLTVPSLSTELTTKAVDPPWK